MRPRGAGLQAFHERTSRCQARVVGQGPLLPSALSGGLGRARCMLRSERGRALLSARRSLTTEA